MGKDNGKCKHDTSWVGTRRTGKNHCGKDTSWAGRRKSDGKCKEPETFLRRQIGKRLL